MREREQGREMVRMERERGERERERQRWRENERERGRSERERDVNGVRMSKRGWGRWREKEMIESDKKESEPDFYKKLLKQNMSLKGEMERLHGV